VRQRISAPTALLCSSTHGMLFACFCDCGVASRSFGVLKHRFQFSKSWALTDQTMATYQPKVSRRRASNRTNIGQNLALECMAPDSAYLPPHTLACRFTWQRQRPTPASAGTRMSFDVRRPLL
jgi:hypothetical protein